jgi:hypothetical protein
MQHGGVLCSGHGRSLCGPRAQQVFSGRSGGVLILASSAGRPVGHVPRLEGAVTRIEFHVEDLRYEHSMVGLRRQLQRCAGIQDVATDPGASTATIIFDGPAGMRTTSSI